MASIGQLLKSSTADAAWAHLYANQITLNDASSSPLVYAALFLNADLAVATTSGTPVQLENWTVVSDPNDFYNATDKDFTIPAGFSGKYLVSAHITITNNTGAGNRYMYVYQDGVGVFNTFPMFYQQAVAGTPNMTVSGSFVIDLVAGQSLGISAIQESAGSITVKGDATGIPAGSVSYLTTFSLLKLR